MSGLKPGPTQQRVFPGLFSSATRLPALLGRLLSILPGCCFTAPGLCPPEGFPPGYFLPPGNLLRRIHCLAAVAGSAVAARIVLVAVVQVVVVSELFARRDAAQRYDPL